MRHRPLGAAGVRGVVSAGLVPLEDLKGSQSFRVSRTFLSEQRPLAQPDVNLDERVQGLAVAGPGFLRQPDTKTRACIVAGSDCPPRRFPHVRAAGPPSPVLLIVMRRPPSSGSEVLIGFSKHQVYKLRQDEMRTPS